MAAVNMDLIHFYQPPINTRLPGKGDGRPTVSDIPIVGGEDPNSTAFRPSHEPSGTFPDDVIEMIDLTASFNPSRERTPDLQDLEANVEDKSNGLLIFLEQIRRDREESIEFPTLEELLSSTRGHASDSTGEEQNEEQYSLDTQPTSMSSLQTGYTTFHRNQQGIPDTPSPCPDGLPLATPGEQAVTPNSGGGEDPEPCAAVKDSQDRRNNERAEADHEAEAEEEEEEPQGDDDKNKTSLLSSTKKRGRSTAGERPPSQRRSKRYRFSSPPSSDDETESDDESVISTCTPSKPYHISIPRPTSSRLNRSEGDISNDKMELAGSRSNRRPIPKRTVIYERQSWAGEVIDEREVKQGRGRPRKQCLIQLKPFWEDAARLTGSGLLQNWRGKKASKCRR